MSLPVPNLDDRDFAALLTAARDKIKASGGSWTDLSVHDPGIVLLEAFAYLTEVMIYRLNRLPEKAYVSFLNMLGVSRHPPSAASTLITFRRTGSETGDAIAIPAGTRVAAAGGADPEPVVFTTEAGQIPAGAAEVTVRAHHYELVEGS
ncbi:baseplate J/gp47 family protein [Phytohabitans houttuyneae]|uniref:Uncharacterized protein n=1 Tax=Phytohabitans houttuyneae TaxID=1076126 RepID=A0A6V8KM08_9ACTN|nr:baseplate J/gp47 family protein [Phytohabitans houttuyneae]GFJ83461.1 hypothetical protein Phou_076410 [Phytohabitans houttuyneae]